PSTRHRASPDRFGFDPLCPLRRSQRQTIGSGSMATPERWSVLVTGATGRIGFPIARALARHHDVYGLARCSAPGDEARLRAAGIVPMVGDVADFQLGSITDAGGRPLTHVFHAAARIGAE